MHRRFEFYIHCQRESQIISALRCIYFLLFCSVFFFPSSLFCQWRKLKTFDSPVNCIYFLDTGSSPQIGFCGTDGFRSYIGAVAKVRRTSDGGKSWTEVINLGPGHEVSDFTFKDGLVGWLTDRYPISDGLSDVLKTVDGGLTWNRIFSPLIPTDDCVSIYYNHLSNRLFVMRWNGTALYSLDDGNSWIDLRQGFAFNGIAFSDDQKGIVSSALNGNGGLITSDGGMTWNYYTYKPIGIESWQPLGIKNSSTFFLMSDTSREVWRSDDGGVSWKYLSTIPVMGMTNDYPVAMPGKIGGDLNKLYIQGGYYHANLSIDGQEPVWASIDQGNSWYSICGPSNWYDTRIYVKGNIIYAADPFGGLWLNTTGKANGPRLQLEKDNLTRHTTTTSGSIIPIDVYYSKDTYYENVDSLIFTLSFNDGMIFNHDSIAVGWKEIRREVTDTNVKFILQRTDPTPPQPDSFILRAYCQATISKVQTGIVALDEINFNQDTTFRDCMIASLSNTDSLFVDITDNQCGDSLLRNFMLTGKMAAITSISPNPSKSITHIEIQTTEKGRTQLSVMNLLGLQVATIWDSELQTGSHSFDFKTSDLPSGSYFVVMTTPSVRRMARIDVAK